MLLLLVLLAGVLLFDKEAPIQGNVTFVFKFMPVLNDVALDVGSKKGVLI